MYDEPIFCAQIDANRSATLRLIHFDPLCPLNPPARYFPAESRGQTQYHMVTLSGDVVWLKMQKVKELFGIFRAQVRC